MIIHDEKENCINPFVPNAPFLYPPENINNQL